MIGIELQIEWPYEGHETEKLSMSDACLKFPDLFDTEDWKSCWDIDPGQARLGSLETLIFSSYEGDVFTSQFCVVRLLKRLPKRELAKPCDCCGIETLARDVVAPDEDWFCRSCFLIGRDGDLSVSDGSVWRNV